MLRVLNIPEVLGLLAHDLKLTLINARDPAFDRKTELTGWRGGKKFVRK